jgi:hypothetical protein
MSTNSRARASAGRLRRLRRRARPLPIVPAALYLLWTLLCATHTPAPTAAAGIPDYRFGVVDAYASPGAARELGAGWERITFRWDRIQPNGPDDRSISPLSDDALDLELAYGREVVGVLGSTPDWATDQSAGVGVPQGLYLPIDDPNNLWARFVRYVVTSYSGRIDHWTIWNEPNIASNQSVTWGGSTDDFIRLLGVAYTVSKEANGNAVVHLPGITASPGERWFEDLLDALLAHPEAASNGYYFDVATLHSYLRPEAAYEATTAWQAAMSDRGLSRPIWIAEMNAPPSEDPSWPVPDPQCRVTLQEQADYLIQTMTLAIAAGAQRMAVYAMVDPSSDGTNSAQPHGLVRTDGSRRPAFAAFQTAAAHLSGFRGGIWERRDSIALVTVDRDWRTTTVVWSRTSESQQAIIPARTSRALRVDSTGAATYVYPERGYYFVDLPGATCSADCSIGGRPVMLVEDAPLDAATALPPSSPTPSGPEESERPKPTRTPPAQPKATATMPPTRRAPHSPGATASSADIALPLESSPRPAPAGRQAWLLAGALGTLLTAWAFLAGRGPAQPHTPSQP